MTVLEQGYAGAIEQQRIVDVENKAFNTHHAVVGYYTAKAWRLPEHMATVITRHHNAYGVFSDDCGQHSQVKNLLSILKMSEHSCESYRVLGKESADHEWNSISHLTLDYVGLSAAASTARDNPDTMTRSL